MKERLLLFLLLSAGIFACSPKYTASFGPSRKFYTENESVKNHVALNQDIDNNLQRETLEDKPISAENLIATKSYIPQKAPKKADELVEKYSKSSIPSTKEIIKMPSKERKQMLKEVKKDIKELKKAKKKSVENRKVYVLQYTTRHYSTLQYTTLQYHTLQYTTVHYSTLQYTTIHYSTLPYTTVHYSKL